MKPFLVTASESYYPCAGYEDWIRCFETLKEAREYVESARIENYDFYRYKFEDVDRTADFVEIIDLRDWIFEDQGSNK